MKLKEVHFKYEDGGEYIVRMNNSGDTILGTEAHKDFHGMNLLFTYRATSVWQRLNFLLKKHF